MSQPTNKVSDAALIVLKNARNKILIPYLIKKSVKKFSWLGLSFINPIFAWVVSHLVDIFYDEAVLLTFFGITNATVNEQNDNYIETINELEITLTENNGDIENENVKKASQKVDDMLADLISFDL